MSDGRLTNPQKLRLSEALSGTHLESVALGYLEIEQETIDNIRTENPRSIQAGNYALIEHWARRNDVPDQVKRLAAILYKSADDGAYVDPKKVRQILGVTREELEASASGGTSAHSTASGRASGNAATHATPDSGQTVASSSISPGVEVTASGRASGNAATHATPESKQTAVSSSTTPSASLGRRLTDAMMVQLSGKIESVSELQRLCSVGLKVDSSTARQGVTNNPRDLETAAYDVIRRWFKTRRNRDVAYVEMCDALTAAGLAYLIGEVLEQ